MTKVYCDFCGDPMDTEDIYRYNISFSISKNEFDAHQENILCSKCLDKVKRLGQSVFKHIRILNAAAERKVLTFPPCELRKGIRLSGYDNNELDIYFCSKYHKPVEDSIASLKDCKFCIERGINFDPEI